MYSSLFIMQIFLSFLLFQLQDTSTVKVHSSLLRLRVQRSLADSPLSKAFLSSDNHLKREEIFESELTTVSAGDILVDESDPGQEQNQQSWLGQDPVDTMLTLCTTTTNESDQPLSLSAKFQQRQTRVPNACPPPQKLELNGQSQGSGKKFPDVIGPSEGQGQRVNPYPSSLELYRLDTFGRAGDPNSICDAFIGQSVPMCAPSLLLIPDNPPNVVAPSRFCKCVFPWRDSFSPFLDFSAKNGNGYFEFLFSDVCPTTFGFFLSFFSSRPHSFQKRNKRNGQTAKLLFEKKNVGTKIDRCIQVIEQFWCCSKGRELDPDTIIVDNLVSHFLPPFLTPIDARVFDTPTCPLSCEVGLTSYLIEGLGFPWPIPKPPKGPIGLPSRRVDVLAVRRWTSLPNLKGCSHDLAFQLFLRRKPRPLAAWIK